MLAAVDSGADQRQPADQDRRQSLIRLAHQERCGGSDLIRETDDADLELSAKQVGLSAQVGQRGQTGDADCDADRALSPGTPETVVYDHRDIGPGQPASPRRRVSALRSGLSGNRSTWVEPSGGPTFD